MNNKVFLYTGRLVARKGVLFLAEAWKRVVIKHPDYILIIIGGGRLQPDSVEDELIKISADNENIFLKDEEKSVYDDLYEADVYIFPSEREGLSNALLEAMSMELPIIATDIGGNRELIKDKETGLLFIPNDEVSLFKAIDSVFDFPELGKNAREKLIKEYSLNNIVVKYNNLYETKKGDI